jgi:hypothetical protein
MASLDHSWAADLSCLSSPRCPPTMLTTEPRPAPAEFYTQTGLLLMEDRMDWRDHQIEQITQQFHATLAASQRWSSAPGLVLSLFTQPRFSR